tara:strand:- start:19971 stop:20399 length:429 start_codon:yes stop_codon:yes gene_type:complete
MQEISDILATFHDGGVEGIKGDFSELEIQIGCAYLAEMEKPGYENFYLTIVNVERFEFHQWNGNVVTELNAIINLDLEIGYLKVEDGIVKISCNVGAENEGDSGGELWIEANYAKLNNHEQKLIAPEKLRDFSKTYWNKFQK